MLLLLVIIGAPSRAADRLLHVKVASASLDHSSTAHHAIDHIHVSAHGGVLVLAHDASAMVETSVHAAHGLGESWWCVLMRLHHHGVVGIVLRLRW